MPFIVGLVAVGLLADAAGAFDLAHLLAAQIEDRLIDHILVGQVQQVDQHHAGHLADQVERAQHRSET